jgi:hypothetical protein
MEQGWVYVLVNASIPGLVKVGRTARLPSTRAAELSSATGVATPFILVFEQAFADCVSAERDIHAVLDRCGMRVKTNREFFRGPPSEIIRLVLQYAAETGDGTPSLPQQSGLDLLHKGDRHLFGEGDTLQDLNEALRCYQLAALRGSAVACERLGNIVAQVHSRGRGGKARAMGYLKEGVRRGNYYCYCEMAAIAAQEGHVANFIKAWDLFFAQRTTARIAEAEEGHDRYPTALQRYLISCFALGITPGHAAELGAEAETLAAALKRALPAARHAPEARRNLAAALRWVDRTLRQQQPGGAATAGPFHLRLPRWTDRWRGATA